MHKFDLQDAVTEHLKGNLAAADRMYGAMISRYPHAFPPIFYRASLLAQQNNLVDAAIYLERAVQLKNDPSAYNNLGTIYRRLNHQDMAKEALEKALDALQDADQDKESLNGLEADINNNLGTIYINEGEPGKGEPFLRHTIELVPDHKQAHWNLGLLLLEQRQWKEGWENYHWGVKSPDRMNRWATWPQWNKENDTVLIYGEQGLGDEIMFASMLPDAIRDAYKVILECHPRLEETFKRSFPDAEVYPTRKEPIVELPDFNYRSAMGDLGMLYRNRTADFPKQPYLKLDEKKLAAVKEGYSRYPRPWIGIGWKGGYQKTRRELRSLPLEDWKPILKASTGTYFSFQYDKDADLEVEEYCKQNRVNNLFHFPSIARHDNYDVILTHLACMDIVIHVNGSGVHACGALGQPCYTLTPSRPAWRYAITGEDVPFYGANVVQIRQKERDWEAAINTAADLLSKSKFPPRLKP